MAIGEIIGIGVLSFMLLFSFHAAVCNVYIIGRRLWCFIRGIEERRQSMVMIVTTLGGALSLLGFGGMNRVFHRPFYQWADNWWWLPIIVEAAIMGLGLLILHERR